MKKIFFIASLCLVNIVAFAQDLAYKIPSSASAVISIKGKNVTDLVTTKEFEDSKIGQAFIKNLSRKTDGKVANLEDLGLNLKESFYYYLDIKDNVLTHVFLAPLKNRNGFENLISEREAESLIKENEFSYMVDKYDPIVTIWNDSTFVVVVSQDEKNDSYYLDDDVYSIEDVEETVVKAAASLPELTFDKTEHDFGTISKGVAQEIAFTFTNTGDAPLIISNAKSSCGCTVPKVSEEPIAPGETGELLVKYNGSGYQSISKTITVTANTEEVTHQLTIKAFVKEDNEPLNAGESEEIVEEILEVDIDNYSDNYYNDSYYKEQEELRKKRQKKREVRNRKIATTTLAKAKEIINAKYTKTSILSNPNYIKSIGSANDEATLWVNDFGAIYNDAMSGLMDYSMVSAYKMFDFNSIYGGMSVAAKLNFDEKAAIMNVSYTMNDEMAKYNKEMYDGKMNKNFFKYFDEDKIQGYFSVNASTEGILNAYPQMIETMFDGVEEKNIGDLASIGTKLFSILLDEEAIADVIRGDMLFVMTDLEEKEVSYTTYEYDENYNSIAIEKTKMETVPGFLFMMTSKEKDLFRRLMKVGIKEEIVKFENGIYEIEAPDLPFALSLVFKDDALILGNSRQEILAIQKGASIGNVSSKHKKLISKNATAVYINGKQILNSIPNGVVPSSYQQKVDYMSDNVEDVVFKVGKMKGNVMEGEMIFNTPENKGHKNSLAYFLNVIESLTF